MTIQKTTTSIFRRENLEFCMSVPNPSVYLSHKFRKINYFCGLLLILSLHYIRIACFWWLLGVELALNVVISLFSYTSVRHSFRQAPSEKWLRITIRIEQVPNVTYR